MIILLVCLSVSACNTGELVKKRFCGDDLGATGCSNHIGGAIAQKEHAIKRALTVLAMQKGVDVNSVCAMTDTISNSTITCQSEQITNNTIKARVDKIWNNSGRNETCVRLVPTN